MKIHSWETPSDNYPHQLEEGETFSWQGRTWQTLFFATSTSRAILMMRRLDLGEDAPLWRWVKNPASFYGSHKLSGWQLGEEALLALQEGRVVRHFYIEAAQKLRSLGNEATNFVSLNPIGIGSLHRGRVTKNHTFSRQFSKFFAWPEQAGYADEEDALNWWKILQREWSDPTSDAAFALKFDALERHQQNELVWQWSRGNHEQVREVLSWALLSQDEMWEDASVSHWRWNIDLPLSNSRPSPLHGFFLSNQERYWSPNNKVPLQEAAELANRCFGPVINQNLQHSICAQKWLLTHPLSFFISIDSPSHHERLEAKLRWREWQAQALLG